MQKKLCFIIFLFSFIFINSYFSIKLLNNKKTINEITRIHVVANSNSIKDQIIKLKVYENINNYIKSLNLSPTDNSNNILNQLKNNSNTILNITNSTLKDNDITYNSKVHIGKIYYDKKESITLDMPAASYNSIKVVLGQGQGKNIWSLVFPNEENIKNLEGLNNILPGITSIYETNSTKDYNKKEYKIKLAELLFM